MTTTASDELKGHISRVTFHGNGFLIARLDSGHTVKGQMLEVQNGVAHTFRGSWDDDAKWGRQFRFESFETELPRDTAGIERYLMQNAKWVGPGIARRLTDAYGEETLGVCKTDPARVAREITGISDRHAVEIAEMLRRNEAMEKLSVAVESLTAGTDISRSVINRIIAIYREEAPAVIRANPYRLIGEVAGVGFLTADKLALKVGFDREGPPRCSAALLHVLDEAAFGGGDVYLSEAEAMSRARTLTGVGDDALRRGLGNAIEHGKVVSESGALWLAKLHEDELYVASKMRALLASKPRNGKPLVPVLDGLQEDQEGAAKNAAASQVAIITGGPGCGKCVSGDTICLTDQGMFSMAELAPSDTDGRADTFVPFDIGVCSLDGNRRSSHFYFGGERDTLKVRTGYGYELRGTPDHRVICASETGLVWKHLSDIASGDHIAIARGQMLFGSNIDLPEERHALDRRALVHDLPDRLTTDLSYLMGLLTGDGYMGLRTGYSFCKDQDPEIADAYINIHRSLFGVSPKSVSCGSKATSHNTASVQIRAFMESCGMPLSTAHGKGIPDVVRRAPAIYVRSFLQGLFDTDGSADSRGLVQWSTASPRLASQVHVALLNFGVIARRRRKTVGGVEYHILDITGDAVREFYSIIGFRLGRKQRRFWELPATSNTNTNVIPGTKTLVRTILAETAPHPRELYHRYGHERRGDRRPSRRKIGQFLAELAPEPTAAVETLTELARPDMFWDPVIAVEPGREVVYDLAVPDGHAFIANGFVNHNTFLVARLVSMYQHSKLRVSLCAPTGKASKRMMEQFETAGITGLRASTIHSLLGPHEVNGRFAFERGECFPLDADVVVVDETSMVDVSLMADLLRAVSPGTRLVLVGDTYQLPSVGPGRVLGDLIASGAVPSFELTKIKRQQPGKIVLSCHAIKEGHEAPIENRSTDDLHFLERGDPLEVRATICDIVERRLPAQGYDPLRDIQVISPLREKTDISCRAFNEALQRTLNPNPPEPKCRFKVGDKVIQRRNAVIDDTPVVNGDIGYVRRIEQKHIEVEFDSPMRLVRIPRRENNLELAYALTIHSVQGSEARAVVIPVHRCFGSRMMQRNLVYTAISRAKELCILVGQRSALSAAIRRNNHEKRMSRLIELLTKEASL